MWLPTNEDRSNPLNGPAGGRRRGAARQTVPTAHPLGAQPGDQNKSIGLDQTSYGAIARVHWGALDRTFTAPYSHASALRVKTSLLCRPHARAPVGKKGSKMAPNLNRDGQGRYPRGPGNRGGHGVSRMDDGFHCAPLNLRLRPVIELPLRVSLPNTQLSTMCPQSFEVESIVGLTAGEAVLTKNWRSPDRTQIFLALL